MRFLSRSDVFRTLPFVVLLAVGFLWTATQYDARHPGHDPDRWYHFALSRLPGSTLAPVPSIEQIDDLGWGKYFYEKEYLFHVLTRAGASLAGDAGVEVACRGLAVVTLGLLLLLTARSVPPWAAFALCVPLVLFSPYFAVRMMQLRPHLFGILSLLVMVWGLTGDRRRLVALGSAMFALSYHAIYIPCAVLGLFAVVYRSDRRGLMLVAFGAAGLVIGVLANPAFPGSFAMTVDVLKIALVDGGYVPGMEAGNELARMSWGSFLAWHFPYLAIVAFAGWAWTDARRTDPARARRLAFLVAASGFLWGLAVIMPRAIEYSVPMTVLTLAAALESFRLRSWQWATLTLGLAAWLVPLLAPRLVGERDDTYKERTEAIFAAIATIPADARGKVYNCSWLLGHFVFYARPDLKLVDVLDPRLLKYQSVEKWDLKRRLNVGEVVDPYGMVRDVFKADYVLCDRATVNAQLAREPRFVPLTKRDAEVAVFALSGGRTPPLARRAVLAHEERREELAVPEGRPPFFDLTSLAPEPRCVTVELTREAFEPRSEGRMLGIGGGAEVSVWVNDEPWLRAGSASERPYLVERLVPLKKPLGEGDVIKVRTCRPPSSHWLLSLSLWDDDALLAFCGEEALATQAGWAFTDDDTSPCVPPLARPRI